MFQFISNLFRTAQEKKEVEFELWQKGFISRARDKDVQDMIRVASPEAQCFYMALVTTSDDVMHLNDMWTRIGPERTVDFLSDTFGVDKKVILDCASCK